MLGAIIGDIIGSPYEFVNVYKRRDVKPFKTTLFHGKCRFTDDTALTLAVARALVMDTEERNLEVLEQRVAENLKEYYERYSLGRFGPIGSLYGKGFIRWTKGDISKRREASTNGATMRITSVGWFYPTMEETLEVAKATVVCTHNTEEAVKASQAVAAIIFLARQGHDKKYMQGFVEEKFGYKFYVAGKEIDKIRTRNQEYRNKNRFNGKLINSAAKVTAIDAITAFLISNSFEDCIRTAISMGGDSDTIACISGGMAEAFYGIPEDWKNKAIAVLKEEGCKEDDLEMILDFNEKYVSRMDINK